MNPKGTTRKLVGAKVEVKLEQPPYYTIEISVVLLKEGDRYIKVIENHMTGVISLSE